MPYNRSIEEYHSILGVSPTATTTERRIAYFKKALQFHPDKNPNNIEAEEKFKLLNEAYAALNEMSSANNNNKDKYTYNVSSLTKAQFKENLNHALDQTTIPDFIAQVAESSDLSTNTVASLIFSDKGMLKNFLDDFFMEDAIQELINATAQNWSGRWIKNLLDLNVSPTKYFSVEDFRNNTPLFYFIEQYMQNRVKFQELDLILKKDPSIINQKNSKNNLPLLFAMSNMAMRNETALLSLFEEFSKSGADLAISNEEGLIALHAAMSDNIPLSLVQLLMEKRVNINTPDSIGQTPIFHLFKQVDPPFNELTYKKFNKLLPELDLEHKDKAGNTILHFLILMLSSQSSKRSDIQFSNNIFIHRILKTLLEKGASYAHKNLDNKSPLDIAFETKSKKYCLFNISRGY